MTFLSRIFFSLLLAAAIADAASVSGGFTIADSKEASVRKRRDYSGIAVWLEPVGGRPAASAPRTHTMVQQGKRFLPHLIVVQAGSSVDFPNFDPIFHNAFSNFSGQPFDVGLYPPKSSRRVQFTRDGVVYVFCNIHAAMSAVIVVVNTPWSAITASDGSFRIPNVPPGEYRLRVWHERASQETLALLEKKLEVSTADVDLPISAISESGYIDIPHPNKFGKAYPPEPLPRGKY